MQICERPITHFFCRWPLIPAAAGFTRARSATKYIAAGSIGAIKCFDISRIYFLRRHKASGMLERLQDQGEFSHGLVFQNEDWYGY